jgi:hypothetical protein
MLVTPEDLRELSDESGASFQRFVAALVVQEAIGCGLNPTDVDADYRVNFPDGGCDIYVRKGRTLNTASLIPVQPSIWSIKAGKNGVDPSKLAGELKDQAHPRLREHIQNGNIFVWCGLEPCGQNVRKKMREKADALAQELHVDKELIQFVWDDHLCHFLNNHLNLVGEYLPSLHKIIEPMTTLSQWTHESPDRKGLQLAWVPVPGVTEIRDRIRAHLLSNTNDAVFHLAGLSGIGKTRTAIEACSGEATLSNTLYIGSFAQISNELWRRLSASRCQVRLIIDEVPLDELTRLQDRFSGRGDLIRIVSIGPAPRTQARRQRDTMLQQMDPPDETAGVLLVVNAAAPELAEDVRKSIAHFAGHDLRLALLLVDATRKNGGFSTAPIRSYEDVWQRIVSRFGRQITDPNRFREIYEFLTISIDVGHAGAHRDELQSLAGLFNRNESDFDAAIRDASSCGLGDKLQNFFEAKPRALAVWLFQERLWDVLNPRLQAFVDSKPPSRLVRRFLERCQETASPYREEVNSRVGDFFFRLLGEPTIGLLRGREASRIFQTWAEFDPKRGLDWLEAAIVRAKDDELRGLTGEPDGSGGWGGRRQIVWLCEHLACFGEFFECSERILFRLAQVETEVRIANNSRNTWKEMFLPVLANTEVSFPKRLEILDQRLLNATEATIELIFSAYVGSIERYVTRARPPSVVGGMIVPDPWEPQTRGELEECRLSSARSVVTKIPGLSGRVRLLAIAALVNEMARFLAYGLVNELRTAIGPGLGDDSLRRRALARLEEWLAWHARQDAKQPRPDWFDAAQSWRDELAPRVLTERIKDLASRDYWSVYRMTRSGAADGDPAPVYAELSEEILEHPAVIDEVATWLRQPEAASAGMLLSHLGARDTESKLFGTMLSWLADPQATNLVASYLGGLEHRSGHLPDRAAAAIDEIAQQRTADALQVTMLADHSPRGVRRILALLPRLPGASRVMLRQLSFDRWESLLGTSEKNALLQQFCKWAESGDPTTVGIAVDMVAMWYHHAESSIPEELVPTMLRLAELSEDPNSRTDDYEWKVMMERLAKTAPEKTAELLADTITGVEIRHFQRGEYAQEIFKNIAKIQPSTAMGAIGKWVLDKRRGIVFRMWEFRGMFDAIGLATVKPWVETHGDVAAIGIARHLDGPKVVDGIPVIPELADWLLSTYGHVRDVFAEFAMGRHSGQVRSGHARDREANLLAFLKHFEGSPKDWIRKWVGYELKYHKREVELDARWDEEDERI